MFVYNIDIEVYVVVYKVVYHEGGAYPLSSYSLMSFLYLFKAISKII